jgi:hypothetical protein
MFSRSSARQTLRLSAAVVSSRLLPMRVSACTVVGVGLPPVTPLARSLCSVALPSPRSTFSTLRITTRPAGSRTLLLLLPVPLPLLSSPLLSMSSRPVSRTETSRTPRVVSESSPTWPRTRVLELSSRDLSPRYVYHKRDHIGGPPIAGLHLKMRRR